MARYYRPYRRSQDSGNQMGLVTGILTLQAAKTLKTEADAVALASADANVKRLANATSAAATTGNTVGLLNLLGSGGMGGGGSSGLILALAISGGL